MRELSRLFAFLELKRFSLTAPIMVGRRLRYNTPPKVDRVIRWMLTRQLSGAPEGHPSPTPGSPAAERREIQELPLNCCVPPERSGGGTCQ
ncbi:hypothetical protein BMS3Abin07_01881 [bacterium BMS3Abin07]|nr:hypothetical protein BMS3Abin07_01881 [bacterium BMS3Abin07]